ncbi:MAG: isochorismatase family cysteine hydrolase [Mycoplasmatota bacterium]|nr:isochorismatase family cysteine hydrolase [Mycoplasmatota bacterium]
MGKIKNLEVYKGMLIVVDMVNGFVREGALHDEKIADVIPRQLELIKEAKARGDLVVFVKDTHDEDAVEFKRFGGTKHCVRDTSEAQLIDEFLPLEAEDNTISIEKNSTSYMEAEKFRSLIGSLSELERVDVIGCCTDICDFNGTMGLANYFDQNNKDVNINIHLDAVATYAEDKRKNYVDAACLLMEQQGIQLVKKR